MKISRCHYCGKKLISTENYCDDSCKEKYDRINKNFSNNYFSLPPL